MGLSDETRANGRFAINRRALLRGATASALGAAVAPALVSRVATAYAQDGTPMAEAGTPGGSVTLAYPQGTSFLHFMHLTVAAGSENIYNRAPVQGKLLNRTTDLSGFMPDLAESWERSEDGAMLTFHLREGLTWHDGAPFSSADVEFTYHMIGVPGLGVYNVGSSLNDLLVGNSEWIEGTADRISGITVPDDRSITFELKDSFGDETVFRVINQVCIAPKHQLEQYLDRERAPDILQSEWATSAAHVGIGPFRVVEYVPDQHVVYEPFEQYWRGRPLLDQLVFRAFTDPQTNAAALENQETDCTRLPISEYERFLEMDHLTLVTPRAKTLGGTPFNTRQPYLSKPIRQALVHAIDRETIAQVLYKGTVDVIHCPIEVAQYEPSPNMVRYDYDPERARALLEEGGWEADRKIRWEVVEIPSDESLYAAINGYWAEVGVEAEYHVIGRETAQMGPPDYNFDLYMSGYPVGSPLDIAAHYDPRLATYVSAGYDTPEFIELWDLAVTQQSEEDEQNTIWRMQEIMTEECLGLWLARSTDVWGINNRVHGLDPKYLPGQYQFDWALDKIWVDQ